MQSSENVKAHNDIIGNPYLRTSLDVALLEYQKRLANATVADLGGCASTHFRSVGAVEFVNLFLNLCESEVVPAVKGQTNLQTNLPKRN